jgi:hypothetical protein
LIYGKSMTPSIRIRTMLVQLYHFREDKFGAKTINTPLKIMNPNTNLIPNQKYPNPINLNSLKPLLRPQIQFTIMRKILINQETPQFRKITIFPSSNFSQPSNLTHSIKFISILNFTMLNLNKKMNSIRKGRIHQKEKTFLLISIKKAIR